MHLVRAIVLTAVILSVAYAVGQDAVSPKPDAANAGDAAYTNECLALVYRLPDGWKFARISQARTGHQSNQRILFKVQRDLPPRLPNRLN